MRSVVHTHTLSLGELAELVELPERTVRLYRTKGIIDPPARRGRMSFYSESHVRQLRTIKALIARGFPLATISEVMRSGASQTALLLILDVADEAGTRRESSVRSLLSEGSAREVAGASPGTMEELARLGVVEVLEDGRVRADALGLTVIQDLVEMGLSKAEVAGFVKEVATMALSVVPVVQSLNKPFPLTPEMEQAVINMATIVVRETLRHTACGRPPGATDAEPGPVALDPARGGTD